jgi:uncharacterized protein (DUF849 family)
VSAEALAVDAAACVAAGAQALHVHPRGADGRESLRASVIDATVGVLHEAVPGIPVGVSTGAWIVPSPRERSTEVASWTAPDMASVNLSEEGHAEVMAALLAAGIGIEAGLATVADGEALGESGFGDRLVRVLVEPRDHDPAAAVRRAAEIDAALDANGIPAPRVHHGYGEATWEVIARAIRLGHGARAGLEDTLTLPGGTPARGNAELVAAAAALAAEAAASRR